MIARNASAEEKKPKNESDIHVLQIIGWPAGGVRLHVHTLIEELNNRNLKVSYAYSTGHADKKFRKEIFDIKSMVCGEVPLMVHKRPHYTDFKNIYYICRYVRNNNVNVIHGHGAKGGLYARVVGLLSQVGCLYTPHGGVIHKVFSWPERLLYRLLELAMIPLTSSFVFESNYTKESFRELTFGVKHQYKVVLNGVGLQRFDPVARETDLQPSSEISKSCHATNNQKIYHLGVFGMIKMEKGQPLAVEAMKAIVEKGMNVHLHLFGDGPLKASLDEWVTDNSIEEFVTFWGDVADVASHMSMMDIIVIPSLFESFGYVAVEALLMERVIVAAKVGGLEEVLNNDQAVFFESGNSNALVGAIEKAIVEYDDRKRQCPENRQIAIDRFSATRMTDELLSLYQLSAKKIRD